MVTLFGGVSSGSDNMSYGLYQDSFGDVLFMGARQTPSISYVFGMDYELINDASYSDPLTGTFLVRSQVPVPAALWLLGSALGMLGWMRRNQVA